jgi:hypothetical protein
MNLHNAEYTSKCLAQDRGSGRGRLDARSSKISYLEGIDMRKVQAMVHSKQSMDEVTIISENGCNNVVAEYNGKKCTAVFNGFVGLYYVDDVYGVIEEGRQ